MLRRLIVAGLAAGLAAPIFAVTPAHAAILFSCTSVSGTSSLTPGLHNTQKPQTDVDSTIAIAGCSNGNTATVTTGSPATPNATTSFPPRPLGCPVALGGAGPEYPDQTPLLLSADPGFKADWAVGADSTGITKVKQGPGTGQVRALLVVTAGQYAPPAGKKTKLKSTIQFAPLDSFDCTNDSDPITSVSVTSSSLIAQQV